MEKIFNLTSTFKALEEDDGGVHICGMASTADQDRANDVIKAEAWSKGGLGNFEKNPIILFNHDYDKPIGRATGLKVTPNGLELKAKISKSAPDHVAQLVKEGILGAFSVGFRVKDADYISETDGLMIKDAELFEVSVVSVPCNQAATFSLSKSFDSMAEYEEFKKTFKSTNRVDLAGQSLANDDVNASSVASDTPDEVEKSTTEQETKMSEVNTQIDLEAFAKKVAEETAAKIAMKQAEEKAAAAKAAQEAEEKAATEAAQKAAQEQEVKSAIQVGVESGAERLLKDVEAKLAEKDAKIDEVIKGFAAQLEEKNEEITKIRESKRVFGDREAKSADITKWGKEFMNAHMLGVITGKGFDTNYGRSVFEKAGMAYDSTDPNIATEVSRQIEKEITLNLRTAQLFREIQINSASQVLPIQGDTNLATWQTGAAASGNLENRTQVSANTYQAKQVVLQAYRLISQTFMDNHVDEEVLVNLMPMLIDSVARAHARAVDSAILNGNGTFSGLDGYASASSLAPSIAGGDAVIAANLLTARKAMGKYGINPADVAYIVSQARYYELIEDSGFADITDVGSDVATKITGAIGAVYGSPVIVSDSFATEADGVPCAFAVNTRNYAIPRLRGVQVETDYEVGNERRVIVATQSLGFEELVADTAGNRSAVNIDLAT